MAHEQKRWSREKEVSWNTIQIVHPGEAFPLFHLARNDMTIRYSDDGLFGGIASRIRLQTRFFEPLNLSITAAPYALPKAAVITPFDRKLGYPLDQEDLSLRSRYKKISSMRCELAEVVEGLGLVVFTPYEDLPLHSMIGAFQEDDPLFHTPEIASLLEHLFLTLIFPGGSSFTARAVCNSSRLFLLFRTFFPTDTGPLPVGDLLPPDLDSLSVEEGFRIFLPFDVDQVQTLHAKFLLLPDLDT
jgi:hypothetical protein